jgi:hypothetical protein
MIGFLVVLGALMPGHVVHGWRRRQNHRGGIVMLTIATALALTGYGISYASDEQIRPWIRGSHWIIGFIAAAALVVHALLGKRTARRSHRRPNVRHVG